MGKAGATILGLALLAGVAFYVGQSFLQPAAEHTERGESVLTGGLDPKIELVTILEDSELPRGLEAPEVDEDLMYLSVEIFYPERPSFPEPEAHHLTACNEGAWFKAEPVHIHAEVTPDGTRASLIYRVGGEFEWGRITHGETVIAERISLE